MSNPNVVLKRYDPPPVHTPFHRVCSFQSFLFPNTPHRLLREIGSPWVLSGPLPPQSRDHQVTVVIGFLLPKADLQSPPHFLSLHLLPPPSPPFLWKAFLGTSSSNYALSTLRVTFVPFSPCLRGPPSPSIPLPSIQSMRVFFL